MRVLITFFFWTFYFIKWIHSIYIQQTSKNELQLTAEFRQNEDFKYIVKIELELELKLFKLSSLEEMNEFENVEMTALEIHQILAS